MKPAQALDVGGAESGRDDGLRQLPADHVVARPAKRRRRLRVPAHDPAVGIHADERIVRRVEHQPRPRLALGEVLHRLPAIGIRERDHDQVGERQREVLLVELPRPRPADVLDAHHAEGPILLAQRHVEHGADAVRRQVGLAELARARIAVRVGRGDDAVVTDGIEVGRHVALVQPLAGGMRAGRALEQVVAAQRRTVVLEPPGADARDLERPRARLEDEPQPIVDRDRHARLTRRQLGQGLALRRQAALAVAQFLLRRIRGVEQPVDGAAELGQVAAGTALVQPRRPAIGVEDLERPRADLIHPPDEPQAKHAGDEQRHADDQAADEQDLFEQGGRARAVPGALEQVEAHEPDNDGDDDGDARLQHAGTGNYLTSDRGHKARTAEH